MRKIHKTYSRLLALTLALALAFGMVPVQDISAAGQAEKTADKDAGKKDAKNIGNSAGQTEEIRYERIDIGTAQEFVDFSKKCYIDSWSVDKYVSLKADIDLVGVEYEAVPVFSGIFDGAGHTVSGFDYTGDGYVSGLFRYIESGAMVRNLTLKGNVASENEKECVGSICGVNYGVIKNCTFQGTVSGRDTVGGISGINERTGTISGCTVKGRVTGYYSTGGITGINHGALNYCSNRAGINDNSEWVLEDDEMGGLGILENLTKNDDNELYSGVDTGGIAGFSDGVISRCTNTGIVGYEHTGYNIGGIAGRQSGIVSLSTNSGRVYGRKDVGGIVGQMEPFIEIDEAESLRNAINKLHDVIEKTIDDMDAAKDVVKGDVDTMQSYADSAIDSGDALVTQLSDFVDENVEEVNSVAERMEHIIDMLPDILDDISKAGDAMSGLNNVAKQLAEDLDILGKLGDSGYKETDYSRITLLSTVGGTLSADSTEPEVNDTVTITVKPEDGYKLKDGSLKVTDANGKKVSVTPTGDNKYTFTMTKGNVKVTAEFVYKGTFLVKSTVGGKVTTSGDGDNVTFKAAASGGYVFKEFHVGGSRYTGAVTDNGITLDRKTYIKEGTSTVVEAVFEKKGAATHRVSVKSGTGGTAYVSGSSTAASGDTVAIHIVAVSGYEYKEMKITGGITSSLSSTDVNERTFTMPDNDVDVEVLFKSRYESDSGRRIFPESNAGGSINVKKGADSSQYEITIKPEDGYDISESEALRFTKVTLSGTAGGTDTADAGVETPSGEEAPETVPSGESPSDNESPSEGENPSDDESSPNGENPSEEESPSNSENIPGDGNGTEASETEESGAEQNPEEEDGGTEKETEAQKETETETKTEEPGRTGDDGTSAHAIQAGAIGKSELTYDSSAKTYKYITEIASGDPDSYSAYATFVKKQDTSTDTEAAYNITTASSTGGVVAVDVTSAKPGDKVYATPASNSGYVLTRIQVNGDSLNPENDGKRYSFTMPAKEAEVTALFEPVDIILKSNLSGNATYSGNAEGKVSVSVKPDTAYTVSSITVTDASGKKLSVSKKQSGSYIYEFDITKMSKAPCTVNVSFKKQNKKQAVDTSKMNIEDALSELSKASDNVQKSINRIKDIVQKPDGSYKSWDELSSSEKDTVTAEVLNLVEYLGDMSAASSAILSSLAGIYTILSPYVSEAAEAAKKDIDKATDHVHAMLDALKSANNGVKGIVNYINAQPDIRFSKLGSEFDATKENFHDQLKGLSDSIRVLSDNAALHSDIVNDDLRAVNDQLNVVFNLLADRMVDIEQLSIEELYEDVDDENIESITTGRADACTNKGVVKGDINVGGIAGSMAIDDEDPEDSAAGSIEYQIGRRFITKCLVTDSVNEGYVTAKKNGAGGICGYMNHGIIVDSECYGSVESTEGDYVGGICGESMTIIRRCYALCSVTGKKNVGGIAGYAETLKNCYSMADVKAENGRMGAIAGQISGYEEVDADAADEGPRVADNYYVGGDINGIDNISYIGVAEPVEYNELLTVEQLPTQFWHLKVIYKIDDIYLGSEEVKYGTPLSNLNYPAIPEKEGFYGVWPDVSDRRMAGTFVVEGEYKDNVTVVQSGGGEPGEGQRQRPYALVEDKFTEDSVLNVTVSSMTPPEQAGRSQNVVYEVTLENSGIRETDTFALRIWNPYEDAVVYGYKDGAWTELESKPRGQYLQVDMTGTQEYFCVAEHKSQTVLIILCTAAGAAALILLAVLVKKGRARRKKRKEGKKVQE